MKLSEQIAAMIAPHAAPGAPAAPAAPAAQPEETPLQTLTADDGDLQALADEVAALHGRRKEMDDRIAVLKERILSQCEEGAAMNTSGGEPAFTVRRNGQRFDPVKAAQVLPAALLDMIVVPKPDAKVAKAQLPPNLYRACLSEGAVTVVLR